MNKARKKKAQKEFYSLAKRLNKRRSENSHSYKSGMKFRDSVIYPNFHKITTKEFHNLIKKDLVKINNVTLDIL